MRNRPAIILILISVVAVVFFQFLLLLGRDGDAPAPTAPTETPVRPQSAETTPPGRQGATDYGDLTPDEYYAIQDAALAAEEVARRAEALEARELELGPRPITQIDIDEGVERPGAFGLQGQSVEEQALQDAEMTVDERAAQKAVEEILNRE